VRTHWEQNNPKNPTPQPWPKERKKERKKKKSIVHAAVAHWLAQNNFYSQLCSSPIFP
jgi:hypothetical protein